MRLSPPLVMGVLVIGGTCALLAAGGAFFVYTTVLGQAAIVVYNDSGETLTVQVDGAFATEVPAHRIDRIAVPQGKHVVTTLADYPVEVDGFSTLLVPTSPSQCLAEVDVSHLYERAPRETPLVVGLWTGDAAVVISSHTEFLRSSLSDQIHPDYAPTLVVPVPCDGLTEESAQAYVVENEARLF